jgi:putative YphP/YqiW family bacilliredoxin
VDARLGERDPRWDLLSSIGYDPRRQVRCSHLRAILAEYPPSSPSIALFKGGKPVYMLHRSDIERRESDEIAQLLTDAFDQFCG